MSKIETYGLSFTDCKIGLTDDLIKEILYRVTL